MLSVQNLAAIRDAHLRFFDAGAADVAITSTYQAMRTPDDVCD